MPFNIKERWDRLSPSRRRQISLGLALILLIGSSWLITRSNAPKSTKELSETLHTDVLLPSKRNTNLDTMSGEILSLEHRMDQLEKSVKIKDDSMQQKFEGKMRDLANNKSADENTRMAVLEKKVDILLKENAQKAGSRVPVPTANVNRAPLPSQENTGQQFLPAPAVSQQPSGSAETLRVVGAGSPPAQNGQKTTASPSKPNLAGLGQVSEHTGNAGAYGGMTDRQLRDISATAYQAGQGGANRQTETRSTWLPAGSLLQGVLLNGLDAPTSTQSRNNPTPILIRIKHEAILPNRYRMDLRECFVIASGYGVMSSERAILRTEKISCVRQDGGVVETSLDGYVVGQDGKVGMRGRLVSRQGGMIAKSILAGLFGGISSATKPSGVASLDINPSGQQQVQYPNPQALGITAAAGGVSTAMDNVSKFYLDQAKEMFPVVEIDAGRKADIVIIRGCKLKF